MFDNFKKKFSLSKITRKLKGDLQEAEFSKNWEEKQNINLKLLWIDFLENESKIMSQEFGLTSNHPQFNKEVRSDEDACLPESLDQKDTLHNKFAEKIIQDYGGVMANPGKYAKCMYKPVSQLPYPKAYIKKVCQFLCKQIKSKHSNWEQPANTDEILNNISVIESFLPHFIEIPYAELATDIRENAKIGAEFDSNLNNV